MDEIKFNIATLTSLLDNINKEGRRQGIMLAIDALRNPKFQETFIIDRVEAEICAEALFTHIDELLK